MFWPEISRGQDVEGKDIGVYDRLISLRGVSNTTWGQTSHDEIVLISDFLPINSGFYCFITHQ